MALGPNGDIVGRGAPAKNCFIVRCRFMEERERFYFIGGMFIPVAEDSTREKALGIVPNIVVTCYFQMYLLRNGIYAVMLCAYPPL